MVRFWDVEPDAMATPGRFVLVYYDPHADYSGMIQICHDQDPGDESDVPPDERTCCRLPELSEAATFCMYDCGAFDLIDLFDHYVAMDYEGGSVRSMVQRAREDGYEPWPE